jgi:uncharacterized protein YbjT (DUF2867 family)
LARALIVGCGCRGRALAAALAEGGFAVRGTTRRPDALPVLEAAGVEAVMADPSRLATLVPHLEGVSVICWLVGADVPAALLEYIVDTPVRGVVHEADMLAPATAGRHRIRIAAIGEPPGDHERWLAAATGAVSAVLG